uniref:IPT/TIG domain-containing protein n=1 Tax=Macrostomum lignano TaxID=282301 RepID=A0A1I8HIB4_9PLAT
FHSSLGAVRHRSVRRRTSLALFPTGQRLLRPAGGGAPRNRSFAIASCSAISARLPETDSQAAIDGLRLTLNGMGFGGDELWLGGDNSSGSFAWINTSKPIANSLWLPGFGPNNNSVSISGGTACVSYKIQLASTGDAVWIQRSGIAIANCNAAFATVCEKPVPKCDPSAISGYNPGTMTATNVTNNKAYYNLFNIGLESSLRCLPGFFRERDSPTATVATPTLSSSGQSVNTMLCGYNMSGSAYSPVVLQGFVEQC